jgi:hypothetical protein
MDLSELPQEPGRARYYVGMWFIAADHVRPGYSWTMILWRYVTEPDLWHLRTELGPKQVTAGMQADLDVSEDLLSGTMEQVLEAARLAVAGLEGTDGHLYLDVRADYDHAIRRLMANPAMWRAFTREPEGAP